MAAAELIAGAEYGDIRGVVFRGNHDGDTFTAELWPEGHQPAVLGSFEVFRVINVRLAGIDTPERKPKCKDPAEALRLQGISKQADSFTFEKLAQAQRIDLLGVRRGKYFRIVATVMYDGKDLGAELLAAGLAKPMNGSRRPKWCEKK